MMLGHKHTYTQVVCSHIRHTCAYTPKEYMLVSPRSFPVRSPCLCTYCESSRACIEMYGPTKVSGSSTTRSVTDRRRRTRPGPTRTSKYRGLSSVWLLMTIPSGWHRIRARLTHHMTTYIAQPNGNTLGRECNRSIFGRARAVCDTTHQRVIITSPHGQHRDIPHPRTHGFDDSHIHITNATMSHHRVDDFFCTPPPLIYRSRLRNIVWRHSIIYICVSLDATHFYGQFFNQLMFCFEYAHLNLASVTAYYTLCVEHLRINSLMPLPPHYRLIVQF